MKMKIQKTKPKKLALEIYDLNLQKLFIHKTIGTEDDLKRTSV
jgi:hypothetical protein